MDQQDVISMSVRCGSVVGATNIKSALGKTSGFTSIPVFCSLGSSMSTRLGMAVPHVLTMIGNMSGAEQSMFAFVYYALCVTLNCMITLLISVRLVMMRHKAETVLGNLRASLYNSAITVVVESGALFSLWSLTYLILRAVGKPNQDVFFLPYSFVLALTRMLIILRMAQDRAWTKEIINGNS